MVNRLRNCAGAVLGVVGAATISGCNPPSPFADSGWKTDLSVTHVFPNAGPTDGLVDIQIRGAGFRTGATVSFDGQATDVVVVSRALITARTPLHTAGIVDVVVTNPDGGSARLPDAYTFAPFAITEVSPDRGLAGAEIRVIG